MRLIAAILALTCLSGCLATTPRQSLGAPGPEIYYVAADVADETCYFRYLNAYALDSVCTRGDDIRYSPMATAAQQSRAMPGYVAALFNRMPVDDLLETRRAARDRLLTQPETALRSEHKRRD